MTTSFTEMTIHLLGMLGLIVLKVKLLEVLKRLCEQQTPVPVKGTINSNFFQTCSQCFFVAYLVFCVDLAHEYIKLGRSKRAGSIFTHCATIFKTGTVTDEVRLRHLLGQAEVLALGDNIPVGCVLRKLHASILIFKIY